MTTASATTERLVGDYAGRLLVVLSTGWLLVQLARLLLPPLLPTIRADLGITLGAAGLLLGAVEGGRAIAQYPGGRFSDGLSRGTLVLAGFSVMTIGLAVLIGVPVFAVVVAGALLFGIGRGFFSVSARTLISEHFVERRGMAFGIFTAFYDIGGILAAGVSVLVIGAIAWRAPYVVFVALFVLFIGGFVVINREPLVVEPVALEIGSTARRMVATPSQRETLVVFSLFLFVAIGFITFLPSFLIAQGFSQTLASSAYGVYFVVGITAKLTAGGASDRFDARGVSAASLGVSCAALVVLLAVSNPAVMIGALFVFAVAVKAQFPLIDAVILDAVPAETAGGDLGGAKTILFGAGALGPAFVGFTAERVGYTGAFGFFAACLLVATVVMYRRRRALER